jgi:hypothetical protein
LKTDRVPKTGTLQRIRRTEDDEDAEDEDEDDDEDELPSSTGDGKASVL